MANIKLRLEVATQKGREHLETLETVAVPRIGDQLRGSGKQTFEVVDVVHTPFKEEWDAVIILKAVTVATIAISFIAA